MHGGDLGIEVRRAEAILFPDRVVFFPFEIDTLDCKQWDGRSHPKRHQLCQSGSANHHLIERAVTMKITTFGVDLAKTVFKVHGVDSHGQAVLKKQIKRDQLPVLLAKLEPCLIGMESCGSAHNWARKCEEFGDTVRLIAPQFVRSYVKTNKNDAADAEAICEAVGRPNMRFVPIKNVEQQAVLSVHRVRQSFVKAPAVQANQIRSLLSEFGLIIPIGIANIAARVPALLEEAGERLPGSFKQLVARTMDHLKELDRQASELGLQIKAWHRANELSSKLRRCRVSGRSRPAPW